MAPATGGDEEAVDRLMRLVRELMSVIDPWGIGRQNSGAGYAAGIPPMRKVCHALGLSSTPARRMKDAFPTARANALPEFAARTCKGGSRCPC